MKDDATRFGISLIIVCAIVGIICFASIYFIEHTELPQEIRCGDCHNVKAEIMARDQRIRDVMHTQNLILRDLDKFHGDNNVTWEE